MVMVWNGYKFEGNCWTLLDMTHMLVVWLPPMIGDHRPSVTNEPVEFEK